MSTHRVTHDADPLSIDFSTQFCRGFDLCRNLPQDVVVHVVVRFVGVRSGGEVESGTGAEVPVFVLAVWWEESGQEESRVIQRGSAMMD